MSRPDPESPTPSRRALWVAAALGAAALAATAAWALFAPAAPDPLGAVEAGIRARFPDVARTTTAALDARLADPSQAPPLLLDAREPAEYAVSHLPGARQIDPSLRGSALAAALDGVAPDREIVVYCSVGARSGGLAARLADAGFSRVSNLEGSIFRWANEGRPLVRDGAPATTVHPFSARWGRLLDADRRAEL